MLKSFLLVFFALGLAVPAFGLPTSTFAAAAYTQFDCESTNNEVVFKYNFRGLFDLDANGIFVTQGQGTDAVQVKLDENSVDVVMYLVESNPSDPVIDCDNGTRTYTTEINQRVSISKKDGSRFPTDFLGVSEDDGFKAIDARLNCTAVQEVIEYNCGH